MSDSYYIISGNDDFGKHLKTLVSSNSLHLLKIPCDSALGMMIEKRARIEHDALHAKSETEDKE